MPLNDATCRNLKSTEKPRKIADGGGLHLLIKPNGSKLWRLSYRFGGKQKTLALGVYPDVPLAEARRKREVAKSWLQASKDPSNRPLLNESSDNFESVAREWHRNQCPSWVPAHAARVLSRLEHDIFPEFGEMPISDIEAPVILDAIRKVEARGALDTAKRLRQMVGAVFRYAIATGNASRDPAADLRGALKKSPRAKHMNSIKEAGLPEYIRKLHAYDGEERTRLALEVVLHTFVRTGEMRFATWSEIEDEVWRIPAARCPSSYEVVIRSVLSFGGSGSFVWLIMLLVFDVASGGVGLSVS